MPEIPWRAQPGGAAKRAQLGGRRVSGNLGRRSWSGEEMFTLPRDLIPAHFTPESSRLAHFSGEINSINVTASFSELKNRGN